MLITNFSEVPVETEDRFAAIFSAYFRYRYNDLPREFWASDFDPAELCYDASGFAAYIRNNITPFYSDFISRFITDLARQWIPSCRAVATKEIFESFFQPKSTADQILARAQLLPKNTSSMSDWFDAVGDMRLTPDTYPLDSFFRTLKEELPEDPLLNAVNNLEISGKKVAPLFGLVSLLEHIVEGHWDAASVLLLTALRSSWFDQQQAFGCDLPMPNLLINSFSGIYGRPYYPNVRSSLRYQYKAKVNTMFTDLIVFDQCRYYYDWFPTVHTSPKRFESVGFQILARCLMDLIGRNDHASKTHPFRGSAVACFDEIPSAKEHVLPLRRLI